MNREKIEMAIKSEKVESKVESKVEKTNYIGIHYHTCSRYNHRWQCQFVARCQLENLPTAQTRIDEICPMCHNLAHGNYGS